MTDNEYLQAILKSQTLEEDSTELKELRERRQEVEKLLRGYFDKSNPTIRYGGSMAKKTMIREAYDLDIICYFAHDDDSAGDTLKGIYENTKKALQKTYYVEPKGVALRISGGQTENKRLDFHIDVVPGRFTDDSKKDTFLFKPTGDKGRLKTNLDIHISHVRDSGLIETIRLLKLWRLRNSLNVKHFALELLAIDLLKGKKTANFVSQLKHIWTELRDHADNLTIEDPSNPTGNDLSDMFGISVRSIIADAARHTIKQIEDNGWESVFGPVNNLGDAEKTEALKRVAISASNPSKPWCNR
jgi:hypothetical protein